MAHRPHKDHIKHEEAAADNGWQAALPDVRREEAQRLLDQQIEETLSPFWASRAAYR